MGLSWISWGLGEPLKRSMCLHLRTRLPVIHLPERGQAQTWNHPGTPLVLLKDKYHKENLLHALLSMGLPKGKFYVSPSTLCHNPFFSESHEPIKELFPVSSPLRKLRWGMDNAGYLYFVRWIAVKLPAHISFCYTPKAKI